jgi:hypothetical protein
MFIKEETFITLKIIIEQINVYLFFITNRNLWQYLF